MLLSHSGWRCSLYQRSDRLRKNFGSCCLKLEKSKKVKDNQWAPLWLPSSAPNTSSTSFAHPTADAGCAMQPLLQASACPHWQPQPLAPASLPGSHLGTRWDTVTIGVSRRLSAALGSRMGNAWDSGMYIRIGLTVRMQCCNIFLICSTVKSAVSLCEQCRKHACLQRQGRLGKACKISSVGRARVPGEASVGRGVEKEVPGQEPAGNSAVSGRGWGLTWKVDLWSEPSVLAIWYKKSCAGSTSSPVTLVTQ